jgi:hypothetical protein
MSLKNSSDTIGNRTRDLPVCSVVPWPLRHLPPPIMDSLNFNVFYVPSEEKVFVLCFNRKLFDSYSAPRHVEGFLMWILAEGGPNDMLLSKTERLVTFTLQFGQYFLDRMISQKWIGRAVSLLPPGHPLQRILYPFDFVFCGYTKDAVLPPPIILPNLARRIQAAAPTVSPVTLLNVRTQLEHRYCAGIRNVPILHACKLFNVSRNVPLLHACKLFNVGHKTLTLNVPTYFIFHSKPPLFLGTPLQNHVLFTCSFSVRK